MTPGARLAAAIDCLDAIFAGQAAEKVLTSWARRSRFAGSKDRAAIRDHVFDVLRAKSSCQHLGQGTSGRACILGLCALQGLDAPALFAGGAYAPPALTPPELGIWAAHAAHLADARALWNMPEDAATALGRAHPDTAPQIAQQLAARAPVDLRVNLRKSDLNTAQIALAEAGITSVPVPISDTALRITDGPRKLRQSAPYLTGLVELQDAGSQALTDVVTAQVGTDKPLRVLDYCAGGGGKSLAMAAKLQGTFVAHDRDPSRMADIAARAERAGVTIACTNTSDLPAAPSFDVVLCDAPCTGSGAWRRSPDAKWRFTSDDLGRMAALQRQVLDAGSAHVAGGGTLAYATCSLFAEENDAVVDSFLEQHTEFRHADRAQFTPLQGTDGFFIALMVRE